MKTNKNKKEKLTIRSKETAKVIKEFDALVLECETKCALLLKKLNDIKDETKL